jgi:hypothetical protein
MMVRIPRLILALSFIVGISPAAGAAGKLLESPLASGGCGPVWDHVVSPNVPGDSNHLSGVEAVSASDVWAVGAHNAFLGAPVLTLTERWDGSIWSIVDSPNSGDSSTLADVSAFSANDVWAVGNSTNSDGTTSALSLRWDGTAWHIVPAASPGERNYLWAIDTLPPTLAWAVGKAVPEGAFDKTLIERWNGTEWKAVPSPSPGLEINELHSVEALSRRRAWAVGHSDAPGPLVMLWNGRRWSLVSTPGVDQGAVLNDISAVGPTDIWAVGTDSTGETFTMHWDGAAWSEIPSPSPVSDFSTLTSVAPVSAMDVWAVGYFTRPDGGTQTWIQHWDGSVWTEAASPNPGNYANELWGADGLTGGEAWAIGYFRDIETSDLSTLTTRYCPAT